MSCQLTAYFLSLHQGNLGLALTGLSTVIFITCRCATQRYAMRCYSCGLAYVTFLKKYMITCKSTRQYVYFKNKIKEKVALFLLHPPFFYTHVEFDYMPAFSYPDNMIIIVQQSNRLFERNLVWCTCNLTHHLALHTALQQQNNLQ